MTIKELMEETKKIIARKFEEEGIYETAQEIQNRYLIAKAIEKIWKKLCGSR